MFQIKKTPKRECQDCGLSFSFLALVNGSEFRKSTSLRNVSKNCLWAARSFLSQRNAAMNAIRRTMNTSEVPMRESDILSSVVSTFTVDDLVDVGSATFPKQDQQKQSSDEDRDP